MDEIILNFALYNLNLRQCNSGELEMAFNVLAIPMKRSAILRLFHAYSDGGNEAGFGRMTILSATVLGHMAILIGSVFGYVTIPAILRLFHA